MTGLLRKWKGVLIADREREREREWTRTGIVENGEKKRRER